MTREEAIHHLYTYSSTNGSGQTTDEQHNEAKRMAIKALEQEPTPKNDLGVDCISRDEVCRYVAEFVNHEFSTREEEELIDNIITGIEQMPSVTPQEPKIGHWIEGQTDNPNIHNILCSCCFEGYPSKGHANSQYTREKFKYCPNCGCRMVEPQESEG